MTTTSNKSIRTTLRLPEDICEAIRLLSFQTRKPANALIAEALSQYLRSDKSTLTRDKVS